MSVSRVTRRVKAFLNSNTVEARKVRSLARRVPGLKQVRQRLANKDEEIAELRAELARKGVGGGGRNYGVKPQNVVWIFGTGRSGSTWLSEMMADLPDHTRWNEPLVGALLGYFYYDRAGHRAGKGGKNFILGQRYKKTWHEPVRSLVLGGAAARFPELTEDGYLVIKEPNGSIGAPLVMEALSESRMILLVRDPRDVVASGMDARKKGGWLYETRYKEGTMQGSLPGDDPKAYVKDRARAYARNMGKAREAYEAHEGRKALVRYEDLRADTLGTMKRIYSELEIPMNEKELAGTVNKHAWENIPEEEKGEGKIKRKAKPGGWREDLTKKQVRIIEETTASVIEEFYSESTS